MPKQMFYNISEEKRKNFIEVAISEFTHKPFDKVSVNSIVKKAGISRGSFYTYFDDLEALFNFIFRDVRDQRLEYAKKLLMEYNGDYFTFIKNLFAYDYDNYSESGKYSLFRNYIHYIQIHKRGSLKDSMLIESISNFTKEKGIKDIFNLDDLIVNQDEFIDLVEIIVLLMINTFLKAENEKLTKEETIHLFNKRISFIEFGIRKGENI